MAKVYNTTDLRPDQAFESPEFHRDMLNLDILREYKRELEQYHKTRKVTPKLRQLRIVANSIYGSVKDLQMFEIAPKLLIHKSVINAYKAVGLTKSQYEFLDHVKGGERMKDRKIRPNNIKEEDLVVGEKFWMYEDKVEKYVSIEITYIRSGVVFYHIMDEPTLKDEYHFEIGCIRQEMLDWYVFYVPKCPDNYVPIQWSSKSGLTKFVEI